jgi:SAM-dependent methyltransferase
MEKLSHDAGGAGPRYLAALEGARAGWWSSANFDTWKWLYVSEYARGRRLADVLRRHVPDLALPGARVVDVGCGDAGALVALAELGMAAAGVEPDAASLARGRLRAEEHGVTVDLRGRVAEALPFDDGAFDLALLDNVLEHVGDPARALAEARRVLRPGGLLWAVTPKPFALHSLWSDPHYDLAGLVLLPRRAQVWYFERLRGAGRGAYDVGTIPTRRRLHRLLRDAGFEPVASPRALWIEYLRDRISRPEEVRPGAKRAAAAWLARREWPFAHPALRWWWDVAIGANMFLARRRG